jgi:hypothetical protein
LDFALPSISAGADRLLREAVRRFASHNAALLRRNRIGESLELSSYPYASGSWYDDRRIRMLVWEGDLVIEGDLVDDHFELLPLLVVTGDLSVRNWLRGGIPGFVGGSVRAAGFIVGHYNDSALFVGGDLTAAGYIRRAKPYPDFPDIAPHQIGGRIDARQFDLLAASDAELIEAFVDDVVSRDGEDVYLDENAILERSSAGLAVWRRDHTEG